MSANVVVHALTFNGGDTVELSPNGITIVVGPNNSGKSQLLREINAAIKIGAQSTRSRVVLQEADVRFNGDEAAITSFLELNTLSNLDPNGTVFRRSLGVNAHEQSAIAWWKSARNGGLNDITELFCCLADAGARLNMVKAPGPIDRLKEPPSHPIHVLQSNEEIEGRFSGHIREAFGNDLVLNHGAGSSVPLHIGEKPALRAGQDRVSPAYLSELAKVPLVAEQGDGVKSFIGCLLATAALKRCITLLDEPEAFLHPPQAYLLGRLLVAEHTTGQLVVATHSADILRGLLDASSDVTIVRVTREGGANRACVLQAAQIRDLWSNPILRVSNVLDGLFHERVVVCEADSDCRFYATVYRAAPLNSHVRDVFFAPTFGKDRLSVVVSAFEKLHVPLRVVADFDLLATADTARRVYEALGGSWSTVDNDYKQVESALRRLTPPLSYSQVCDRIRAILEDVQSSEQWTGRHKLEVGQAMKATSAWHAAKQSGKAAIPAGGPTTAVDRILAAFKEKGLYVVPTGELESFDRSCSEHGPSWLAVVVLKNLATGSEFEDARKFVGEFCAK